MSLPRRRCRGLEPWPAMARRDSWWDRLRRAPSPTPREVGGRKAGWGHLARSRGARLGEYGPGRLVDCPPGVDGTTRAHTSRNYCLLRPCSARCRACRREEHIIHQGGPRWVPRSSFTPGIRI